MKTKGLIPRARTRDGLITDVSLDHFRMPWVSSHESLHSDSEMDVEKINKRRLGRMSPYLNVSFRTGVQCLTALAILALGSPCWAPEDPWQFVASVPQERGSQPLIAEVVSHFLEIHHVRMSPERMHAVAESVMVASRKHDLDAGLLLSMILLESSFQPDAVSEKGAVGLMQLLPSTAEAIAQELDLEWADAHLVDPRKNITLGAAYFKKLMKAFDGDVPLALTAYNKGPGYVLKMQRSGVMEATASNFPSSYAERVFDSLSRLYPDRGRTGWRAPSPHHTPAQVSQGT